MNEFVRTRKDVCERYSREENKIFDIFPLTFNASKPLPTGSHSHSNS